MQEARNLRALREMTPLLGSDAPLPELYEGTGFQVTLSLFPLLRHDIPSTYPFCPTSP